MSGSNDETLKSYEHHVQRYIDGTSQSVFGAAKAWIDAALSGVPPQATLIELGSAFGRDAAYIASQGYVVECTDAVQGFVLDLRARGFDARQFNVLTDDLSGAYDLIFANAVLLHFTRAEFSVVLKKLFSSLKAGGRFAFSLKQGRGEGWSSEKLGAPRYFCYWERESLEPLLAEAGFARWTITQVTTERAHAEWLFVTAIAP